MPHLKTFARLHVAGSSDVSTLRELEAALHGDAGAPRRNWPLEAANRDSYIVLAMECHAAVGAAEVVHCASHAVATLVWLGVAHSARGRGIGQLLVENAIEHARGEGAAVLRLGAMTLPAPALGLLTAAGFAERRDAAGHAVLEKSLWDERTARQTRTDDPRFYGAVGTEGTAAAALMVAMATLDSRFIMTPQVERVLAAEISLHADAAAALPGLAVAAAHRGFSVVAHGDASAPAEASPAGAISPAVGMPAAEELFGRLAQRRIPLLQAGFERLGQPGPEQGWAVVLGFDGLLFQLFDPRRPEQRDQAVTLREMRAALAQKGAACLVLGRR